ncbi:zinc finger protein 271-like [Bradysia coprophila]|uniref:zinc finger protein 271-like n=1 Tax=Bradysia coprophila TaxID=38358 RepID=UPI00187D897C|nr:zinc finger protein 271-like [Bradysia coprophila]XP_037051510.1 zinc finger protein 271-like [Bradysia coprophila]
MRVCRACLAPLHESTDAVNILDDLYKNQDLSILLLDLFTFKIEANDEISKELCQRCAGKIVDIHDFYVMYVESDRKLRALNETDCKPNLESYDFDGDSFLPHEIVAVVKKEDCAESLKSETDDDFQKRPSSSSTSPPIDAKPNAEDDKLRKKRKRFVSQWECFACHKTYKSIKTIRKHSRACCLQIESQGSPLKKERLYHNNQSNEFVCDLCGKCFPNRRAVYSHIQKHTGQKVLCNICGKCFSNRNNLTKHHKTVHLKEKNYQCPTCEKRYDSSYRLRIHQNAHAGIRLFGCSLCPQSFITSSALSRHKKTVHKQGELYECNVCFRKFNVAYNMRAHMVTHTGIKPHICQYCKADFHRKHKLVSHMKEVHKLDWPQPNDQTVMFHSQVSE